MTVRHRAIVLLVTHGLAKAAAALHKPVPTPPLALYQLLNTYAFPGNVRELEAMVFDAVARHQGGSLALQAFKDAMGAGRPLLAGEPWSAPALSSQQCVVRGAPPHLERGRRRPDCRRAAARRRQSGRGRGPAGCVAPGVE